MYEGDLGDFFHWHIFDRETKWQLFDVYLKCKPYMGKNVLTKELFDWPFCGSEKSVYYNRFKKLALFLTIPNKELFNDNINRNLGFFTDMEKNYPERELGSKDVRMAINALRDPFWLKNYLALYGDDYDHPPVKQFLQWAYTGHKCDLNISY